MSFLERLFNPNTQLKLVGDKPVEQRPLSQVILNLAGALERVRHERSMWDPITHVLNQAREPVMSTMIRWTNRGHDWAYHLAKKLTDDPLLMSRMATGTIKAQHVALKALDGFFTLGMVNQKIEKLDQQFFQTLYQTGLTSEMYSSEHQSAFGMGNAAAYFDTLSNEKAISIEKRPGGQINPHPGSMHVAWERWMILAHEAGHLEYKKQGTGFTHDAFDQNTRRLFSRHFLNPDSPFSRLMEETTVEMFAAASILKLSDFSEESIRQIEFAKEERLRKSKKFETWFQQTYAKAVHRPRGVEWSMDNDFLKKDLNLFGTKGSIAYDMVQKSPYLWCGEGIGEVLKSENLETLKTLPFDQVLPWVTKLSHQGLLQHFSSDKASYRERHGQVVEDSFQDGLHYQLQQQLQKPPYAMLERSLIKLILTEMKGFEKDALYRSVEVELRDSTLLVNWMKEHASLLSEVAQQSKMEQPKAWKMIEHFDYQNPDRQLADELDGQLGPAIHMLKACVLQKLDANPSFRALIHQYSQEKIGEVHTLQERLSTYFSGLQTTENAETTPPLKMDEVMNNLQARRQNQWDASLQTAIPHQPGAPSL